MSIEITYFRLDKLILYSFRYALGRSTYVVSDTADLIRPYMNELSIHIKLLMVREIDRANDLHNIGMDMDKDIWLTLRDELLTSLSNGVNT